MYVYLPGSGKHGTLSENAIMRGKDIKKWKREWKIRLIEEDNPDWFRSISFDNSVGSGYDSGLALSRAPE